MDEVQCDKCGSSRVAKVMLNKDLPNVKPKTMEEYIKNPPPRFTTHNAVMIYHRYRFECQNCGHKSKEFTE